MTECVDLVCDFCNASVAAPDSLPPSPVSFEYLVLTEGCWLIKVIDAFVLRRKYNVPVQMITHPGVSQYISDFVVCLQPVLAKKLCRSVSLTVVSMQQHPLEKFVVEIDSLQEIAMNAREDEQALANTQQHIRACLLKLHACESMLSNITPGCTYTLAMETKEEACPLLTKEETAVNWVPTTTSHPTATEDAWTHFVPFKTLAMGYFKITMFILESDIKAEEAVK